MPTADLGVVIMFLVGGGNGGDGIERGEMLAGSSLKKCCQHRSQAHNQYIRAYQRNTSYTHLETTGIRLNSLVRQFSLLEDHEGRRLYTIASTVIHTS